MHNDNAFIGHMTTLMAWMFTIVSPSVIPVVLASLCSIMGCINYYYSIKKNRQK